MMRTKQLSLIVGSLATAAIFAFAGQANAGWGSSGSWGSSSSSSGSWGSSSSSSGGWGSSSSSSGGWRHHHRHYYRGSSSSSSGSWGRRGWGSSSSSSGGYSYSYGSSSSSSGGYSYGSSSSSSSSGGSSYQSNGNWTPVDEGAPSPSDAPAPPAETEAPADSGTSIQQRNTTVSFSVSVPEDATIFVNDNATTSTGTERTYISRGLQAGKSYTFHVRAELVRDGKTLTETKKIRLVAGQHTALAFEFAPNTDEQLADKPVETKLTLNVPAEAKVYLSGRATASTGEVREFATTKLIPGKTWADYVVVVTYEKDGQLLSQEKNVTLNAGDSREVTFDFENDKVAVNN